MVKKEHTKINFISSAFSFFHPSLYTTHLQYIHHVLFAMSLFVYVLSAQWTMYV